MGCNIIRLLSVFTGLKIAPPWGMEGSHYEEFPGVTRTKGHCYFEWKSTLIHLFNRSRCRRLDPGSQVTWFLNPRRFWPFVLDQTGFKGTTSCPGPCLHFLAPRWRRKMPGWWPSWSWRCSRQCLHSAPLSLAHPPLPRPRSPQICLLKREKGCVLELERHILDDSLPAELKASWREYIQTIE